MDGEYTWLVKKGNECYTVNKYGAMRSDFPVTIGAKQLSTSDFILIGELYWGEGKRGALYELLTHKGDDKLNFMPFDVAQFAGVSVGKAPLVERLEMMHELGVDPTVINRGRVIEDKDDLKDYCDEIESEGYEGVVVKGLESVLLFGVCSWIKIKKKDQNDYPVSMIDPVKERIEVEVLSPGNTQAYVVRNVGCKCSNTDKAKLKVGDMVTIEHQGILAQGGLRHPVFKGKV